MKKREYEEWYETCDFIREELKFYSFPDFMLKAKRIKLIFKASTPLLRILYRWYIFANVNIGYKKKCLIWDYLNDYKEYEQLALHNQHICKIDET